MLCSSAKRQQNARHITSERITSIVNKHTSQLLLMKYFCHIYVSSHSTNAKISAAAHGQCCSLCQVCISLSAFFISK